MAPALTLVLTFMVLPFRLREIMLVEVLEAVGITGGF